MSVPRATLAAPGRVEGAGLFTGKACAVELEPAPAGDGIAFIRDGARIPATIDHLSATPAHPAFAQMPPRNTGV